MKTFRTIIVCALTVSLILAVYTYRWDIGAWLIRDYPPVRIQTYTSPDQRYIATMYFMRDHAEGNFRSVLILSTGGDSFAHDDRVITLLGSTAIECTWTNEHLLTIRYHGFEGSDSGPSLSQWKDVKIEYVKLLDPNEAATKQKP